MARLSSTEFFLSFFAALKQMGCKVIRTKGDEHQKKFQAIKGALTSLAGDRYPLFVPSPFTGRYQELDDALLQLQTGILGAKNPYYPEINIEISDSLAERILSDLKPEDRALFKSLAEKFVESERVPA